MVQARSRLVDLQGNEIRSDKDLPRKSRQVRRAQARRAAKPQKRWNSLSLQETFIKGKLVGIKFIVPEANCYIAILDINKLAQIAQMIAGTVQKIAATKPIVARTIPAGLKPPGAA